MLGAYNQSGPQLSAHEIGERVGSSGVADHSAADAGAMRLQPYRDDSTQLSTLRTMRRTFEQWFPALFLRFLAHRLERVFPALARRLCSERGMAIGSDGVQLLGGHGYVKEHPVERWYRDLRAVGVMEGALLV